MEGVETITSIFSVANLSYDNLDENCLADCYAVSVKTLENFDKKYSK